MVTNRLNLATLLLLGFIYTFQLQVVYFLIPPVLIVLNLVDLVESDRFLLPPFSLPLVLFDLSFFYFGTLYMRFVAFIVSDPIDLAGLIVNLLGHRGNCKNVSGGTLWLTYCRMLSSLRNIIEALENFS